MTQNIDENSNKTMFVGKFGNSQKTTKILLSILYMGLN